MEEQKQPPKMATTEEMNVTIALYMELYIYYLGPHRIKYRINEKYKKNKEGTYTDILAKRLFFDWRFIMQTWEKLKKDLETSGETDAWVFKDKIGNEILAPNITEAHRLIYEAITWLNKNK